MPARRSFGEPRAVPRDPCLPALAERATPAAKHVAGFGTPALMQAAVADFITEGHLLRHVRRMRAEYAKRRRTLEQMLKRHLGDRAEIFPAIAGLHLAVGLLGGLLV